MLKIEQKYFAYSTNLFDARKLQTEFVLHEKVFIKIWVTFLVRSKMESNRTEEQVSIPESHLISIAIGTILIAFWGIFGNVNIILATYRSKNLRNKSNFLICFGAVADLLYDFGFLQYSNDIVNPSRHWMTNSRCFWSILYFLLAMYIGASMIWICGLDRLFAIKFAIKYRIWTNRTYLTALILPVLILAGTDENLLSRAFNGLV